MCTKSKISFLASNHKSYPKVGFGHVLDDFCRRRSDPSGGDGLLRTKRPNVLCPSSHVKNSSSHFRPIYFHFLALWSKGIVTIFTVQSLLWSISDANLPIRWHLDGFEYIHFHRGESSLLSFNICKSVVVSDQILRNWNAKVFWDVYFELLYLTRMHFYMTNNNSSITKYHSL